MNFSIFSLRSLRNPYNWDRAWCQETAVSVQISLMETRRLLKRRAAGGNKESPGRSSGEEDWRLASEPCCTPPMGNHYVFMGQAAGINVTHWYWAALPLAQSPPVPLEFAKTAAQALKQSPSPSSPSPDFLTSCLPSRGLLRYQAQLSLPRCSPTPTEGQSWLWSTTTWLLHLPYKRSCCPYLCSNSAHCLSLQMALCSVLHWRCVAGCFGKWCSLSTPPLPVTTTFSLRWNLFPCPLNPGSPCHLLWQTEPSKGGTCLTYFSLSPLSSPREKTQLTGWWVGPHGPVTAVSPDDSQPTPSSRATSLAFSSQQMHEATQPLSDPASWGQPKLRTHRVMSHIMVIISHIISHMIISHIISHMSHLILSH